MMRPLLRRGAALGVANHKSAKKRARQALQRRARNRQVRGGVRTAVKSARRTLAQGEPEAAVAALRGAERLIRKAASKGVIPKKRASRQVSRLAKQRGALES
jgi:small subunit ribosomal protein S20